MTALRRETEEGDHEWFDQSEIRLAAAERTIQDAPNVTLPVGDVDPADLTAVGEDARTWLEIASAFR